MALSLELRLDVGTRADARSRLLGELAGAPARKGYGIAYDLLGNRAEAEEAVQEALARACESIADLREPAAAPAWFLRIVTTMCLRTLRRRRLRRAVRLVAHKDGDRRCADERGHRHRRHRGAHAREETTRARCQRSSEREELSAMLERLEELSPQQRTALVLRYGHDLPVSQIAELLGVELATAKTHLVRGLARLRDLMEEHR